MSRYLVVAHHTAESPELGRELQRIAAGDPRAEFTLLVPSVPTHRLVSDVGDDATVARRRASSAAAHWLADGLNVTTWTHGDANAVDAVRDRIAADARYAAIVISTLPPGLSHWLRLDLVSRIERLGRPVRHVVAKAHPAPSRLVARIAS